MGILKKIRKVFDDTCMLIAYPQLNDLIEINIKNAIMKDIIEEIQLRRIIREELSLQKIKA